MKTIIIGSGAGGGIAAMVLTRAGQDVVVFEKGPWWKAEHFSDDEIKFGSRGMINLDHRTDPRTWKHGPAGTTFQGRILPSSQCVGGGTVHYAAMSFRLRPEDFQVFDAFGPVPGGNVHNWPFTYDEIEPYYTRTEYLIGVQGLDRGGSVTYGSRPGGLSSPLTLIGNAAQADRSKPFPMPPGPGKIDNLIFAKAAKDMGFHPYPCPLAVNSTNYASQILDRQLSDGSYPLRDTLRLRQRCEECGMCSGYGCPIDAKNSTLVTAIEAAQATGNLDLKTGYMVSRIEWKRDPGTIRVTKIWYRSFSRDTDGRPIPNPEYPFEVGPDDRVIVAADGIETPRLFLLSGLDELDRSGQLGRNLMTNHLPAALGFFSDLVNSHRGVYTTHVIDDLYVIPWDALPQAVRDGLPAELRDQVRKTGLKAGVVAAAGPSAGEPLGIGGLVSLAGTLPWGEAHIPALQNAFGHQIYLGMVGDDVPQLQNRVTLDPKVRDVYGLPVPRVEQTPHQRDLAVIATAGPIMQQILEKAGANVTAIASATPPLYPSQYNHRMGTMRMGKNPATSVVDENGKFWAVENLYVMDGSVMVSAGGYNPTETIQAVAWKLAERLI